jgi:hypothetical protein
MGEQIQNVHVTYKGKKDKYKNIYSGIYNIRSCSQPLGKRVQKLFEDIEINEQLNIKNK